MTMETGCISNCLSVMSEQLCKQLREICQDGKVFIYGNHDHHREKVYYDAGFELVSKWPIVIQNRYLLSHAPMFAGSDSGVDPGNLINIHGHIHDKVEQGQTISAASACVCVERWGYAPVDLRVIEKEIRKISKK